MPYLHVKLGTRESATLARDVAGMLAEVVSRVLGENPRRTSVTVEFIDPDAWFIDGRSLSEIGKSAARVEFDLVEETHSRVDKAACVNAVFEGLSALLEDLHGDSWVCLRELRASSHGAGGFTEEHRHQHGASGRRQLEEAVVATLRCVHPTGAARA